MPRQIFLLRHAIYCTDGSDDPCLSQDGKEQALALAQKIKNIVVGNTDRNNLGVPS
ncbi:MAG: hypothetical protein QG614_396 [Patescibacteria group bacterium]|nr:hypothetical protein [Patescibacteria group bacterium]